jgi:hypothetical protein
MSRAYLIAVIVLLASSVAGADIYIKEVNGTDLYVLGWNTGSTKHSASELWLGDTKIAYRTPGRVFIVDLEEQTFTLANTTTRTFVETALPLDLSAVLSEHLAGRYEVWRRSGVVSDTGDTMEILGKTATEYEVEFWEVEDGKKSNELSGRVWATTDVSFDWRRADELMVPMRMILNRDEELREELLEIQGAQLRVEWWVGRFGCGRKHFTEVVEIVPDREPPPGVYAAPAGYARKERLTQEDL